MCDQPRGVYDLNCLDCCTKLVMSAYPNKRVAAVLLESIDRYKGAPSRAEVVESVGKEANELNG
jgi:hypothetical protein